MMSYNNTTSVQIRDKYDVDPTVECYKLRIIGVYCLLLFITSAISNAALLLTFIRNRALRTSLNMFIIALTALNLFGTLVELPFIFISNLYCKWIWKEFGCIFSAYLMYFVGCSSIYLMAAISFERFYIIYRPMSIRKLNIKANLTVIVLCCLNGLLWASFPLIGWSHYSLEGAMTSCAAEWRERSFNVTSYNITIFALVYMLPLITILSTNVKLLMIVKSLPATIKATQDAQAKKRIANERYITIVIILIILTFVVSWTPYALVSMYSAFISEHGVPPLGGTLPAVIAKSSMLWTSLIYIFSNKSIRVEVMSCCSVSKSTKQKDVSTSRVTKSKDSQDTGDKNDPNQDNSKL